MISEAAIRAIRRTRHRAIALVVPAERILPLLILYGGAPFTLVTGALPRTAADDRTTSEP